VAIIKTKNSEANSVKYQPLDYDAESNAGRSAGPNPKQAQLLFLCKGHIDDFVSGFNIFQARKALGSP
jgi:hypothetical protein